MTIEKLFGIPGAAVPAPVRLPDASLPAEAYPTATEPYRFPELLLKKLLRFFAGDPARKNLLLIGEPGVGKTSVILEVCARLRVPVFALSCSGRTRFAHMIGGYEFVGGETRWRDGPLVRAMRSGGVFLANEVTRLDAGEQMNLAEALDGSATVTIPDTGEVVRAQHGFRFVATGNTAGHGDDSGAYPGEKAASVAFIDRFQKIAVEHLPHDEEKALVMTTGVPEQVAEKMVKMANEIRSQFIGRGGQFRTIFSTRSLMIWAKEAQGYALIKGLQDPLTEALNDTILNGAPGDEREVVHQIWKKWMAEA